jgi:hypothetical protein
MSRPESRAVSPGRRSFLFSGPSTPKTANTPGGLRRTGSRDDAGGARPASARPSSAAPRLSLRSKTLPTPGKPDASLGANPRPARSENRGDQAALPACHPRAIAVSTNAPSIMYFPLRVGVAWCIERWGSRCRLPCMPLGRSPQTPRRGRRASGVGMPFRTVPHALPCQHSEAGLYMEGATPAWASRWPGVGRDPTRVAATV